MSNIVEPHLEKTHQKGAIIDKKTIQITTTLQKFNINFTSELKKRKLIVLSITKKLMHNSVENNF